jgi:hypothetical protein
MGIFTLHELPPMTELTYDYGYVEGQVEGKTLQCNCGEAECRGALY